MKEARDKRVHTRPKAGYRTSTEKRGQNRKVLAGGGKMGERTDCKAAQESFLGLTEISSIFFGGQSGSRMHIMGKISLN